MCGQLLSERIHDVGRHRSPTVLYMPRLEELEKALQLRVGFGLDRLLDMLPRWAPLLVLLTSVRPYTDLAEQQRAALATAHLHKVVRPGQPQRTAFFTTLLSHGERGVLPPAGKKADLDFDQKSVFGIILFAVTSCIFL